MVSDPDPAKDLQQPVADRRSRLADLMRDPATALVSQDPAIRRLAVAAAADQPRLRGQVATMLSEDPVPAVRRECAEALGMADNSDSELLEAALSDDDATVREAAAFALGEIASASSVRRLIEVSTDDTEESLVREAAVAALGAIGDPAAVPTLLELIVAGPPQVRRRCVPALTVFDDSRIEPALRSAVADRNPMVREAAEMVVGRTVDEPDFR